MPWLLAAAALLLALLAWTGMATQDRFTWALESFPVMVVLPLLVLTHRRYPLTTLLYVLVFLHAVVLIYGGMYTYARAPLGFVLQDWLGTARNPYDKVGHFMQGLVPALAAREVLRRIGPRLQGFLLAFLCVCVVMMVSSTYELLEWLVALLSGQSAEAFLGTQEDPWDTQSDMLFALVGAVCCVLLLPRWHERQLARPPVSANPPAA